EVCADGCRRGFHRLSPFAWVTSRKERAVPAARSPEGETPTREPCAAAPLFLAEQGEWSGPASNARRGAVRRAATVTQRKEQMRTGVSSRDTSPRSLANLATIRPRVHGTNVEPSTQHFRNPARPA